MPDISDDLYIFYENSFMSTSLLSQLHIVGVYEWLLIFGLFVIAVMCCAGKLKIFN